MADRVISNPIINSPYRVPSRHFAFDNDGITDRIVEGRRESSYFVPVPRPRKRGVQRQLELGELTADQIEKNQFVNEIRVRVGRWRDAGYPDVTAVTRRLLEYWTDPGRDNPVLFCQLEAAETAIYLAEAAQKVGDVWIRNELERQNEVHNARLNRIGLKMATGSGKTVVMAMLIAWQTLNKAASPNDARFARRFLIVTPGLTIRDRLRVLRPEHDENYYKLRDLVPADLEPDLAQARMVITNFHTLQLRETAPGRGIAKTTKELLAGYSGGPSPFQESPGQMVSRVCRDLGGTSEIVVFNDEAHHCYQGRDVGAANGESGAALSADEKAEARENSKAARIWFTGLRAIAGKLGVKAIYDLSATPSFLSGSGYREGTLFPWVVSDFGRSRAGAGRSAASEATASLEAGGPTVLASGSYPNRCLNVPSSSARLATTETRQLSSHSRSTRTLWQTPVDPADVSGINQPGYLPGRASHGRLPAKKGHDPHKCRCGRAGLRLN